ncbi:MAG: helix-turn-helix domain-containing protein [Candidatus Cryptobacteroides sp.]|nr:helix-turn-helix domain-containing protein [Candidatus Cryptobacteroides sp.]
MDDIYTLSDTQLSKRIGEKLKAIRLKRNITQQSLAEAASISLSSVKKVENGEIGAFDTLLRILRTLGMLESISQLFEEEHLSPSEYYEMVNKAKKQTRKRAVGKLKVNKEESEW